MWSIEGGNTSYGLFTGHNWFTYQTLLYLSTHSLAQAQERYRIPPYFIKFNGQAYVHMNFLLTKAELLACLGADMRPAPESILNQYLL